MINSRLFSFRNIVVISGLAILSHFLAKPIYSMIDNPSNGAN